MCFNNFLSCSLRVFSDQGVLKGLVKTLNPSIMWGGKKLHYDMSHLVLSHPVFLEVIKSVRLIFLCSPLPDLRVSRPLIVPGYPENTTAVVGSQAKLVCKVHRPTSTKVQWLKTEVSAQGPIRLRALTVRDVT